MADPEPRDERGDHVHLYQSVQISTIAKTRAGIVQRREGGRLLEIAPELTGHGLTLSKCEAYNRVYGQFYRSRGATFAPAEDQNGKSLFRREGIEHSRP